MKLEKAIKVEQCCKEILRYAKSEKGNHIVKEKCLSVVKQYAKKHGVNVKHIKKILEL